MAGYRQFHTKFWKDEYLIELEPLEKYLFLYLFTNDLSSISGLYKIPLKVIRNETDLDDTFITKTLNKFQDDKRIFYRDGVMWVINMAKYHANASPTTKLKVSADVSMIPECDVKNAYLYFMETGICSIDTLSIPHPYPSVKAKEKAKDKTKEKASESKSPPSPFPVPVDFEFSSGWQVRVFTKVTGISGIPGSDMPKVMEALDSLQGKYSTESELTGYLTPYFQNWINRKTKDGRRYSKSNCAWLYDIALAGEPLPSDKPAPNANPDPNCPICGGIGFTASSAKYGESTFGKLQTCSCVKVREVSDASVV
jgi:hypothetical protein